MLAALESKKALVGTKHWFLGRTFPIPITYRMGCDFVYGGVSWFVVLSSLTTCKADITDRLPLF